MEYLLKSKQRGAWVVPPVKHLTLDLSSWHKLRVLRWSPSWALYGAWRLLRVSLSLPLRPHPRKEGREGERERKGRKEGGVTRKKKGKQTLS